jgi:hypothetical protein
VVIILPPRQGRGGASWGYQRPALKQEEDQHTGSVIDGGNSLLLLWMAK